MSVKEISKGTRFERLVATGRYEVRGEGKKSFAYFECLCDCGNVIWTRGAALRYGTTKSCGCYKKDKLDLIRTKHGYSKTRLYRIWCAMKARCYNKNSDVYYLYGERGIKICSDWLDLEKGFENFKEWSLLNGYKETLTIDRIDPNGDYEPDNCRWVNISVQNRNKRNNRVFVYNGQRKVLLDLAKENGISYSGIRKRLKRGMTIEEAIETPLKNQKVR